MSKYTNELHADDIGVYDIVHYTVHFKEIINLVGNLIFRLYRYDMNNPADTGVDISAQGSVSTNYMEIDNIWAVGETPAAGKYRVQAVLQDPNAPISQATVNIIQKVLVG